MLMLRDMVSEWLETGSMKQLKKKNLFSPAVHPGRECPCYVRKILGFHEWLLEALFFGSQCRTLDVHINYRRLHEILN